MKGVALNFFVGMVIAIFIGVILLLILTSSGLLSNFEESITLMIVMLSAYLRLMIVKIINIFVSILATLLLIVFIMKSFSSIGGAKNLLGLSKSIMGVTTKTAVISGGFISMQAIDAIASLIIFTIIAFKVLPAIPLFSQTINVNIGSSSETNVTLVSYEIAERIDNTWKVFGSGLGDPLEGLRNPTMLYALHVHLAKGYSLTMDDVYSALEKKYGAKYPIYVYCANSEGIYGSPSFKSAFLTAFNPSGWVLPDGKVCDVVHDHTIQNYGSKCTIENGDNVKIYYFDSFSDVNIYAQFYFTQRPYGCPYVCGIGNTPEDAIIVCITS